MVLVLPTHSIRLLSHACLALPTIAITPGPLPRSRGELDEDGSEASEHQFEKHYRSFVHLLDPDDMVARKAISILFKDVETQAKRRKIAIDSATRVATTHQQSSNAPLSLTAPRRSPVLHTAGRWGEIISSSNYNDSTVVRGAGNNAAGLTTMQAQEAAEYDAIIQAAQRRVASPLPLPGALSTSNPSDPSDNRRPTTNLTMSSATWRRAQALIDSGDAATDFGDVDLFTDSEDGDDDDDERDRVQMVGTTLARAQFLRGGGRGRTGIEDSIHRNAIINGARRLATQGRAEDAGQQEEQQQQQPRERPGLSDQIQDVNASWESWDPTSVAIDEAFPIVIGGNFSDQPTSVTRSASDTLRTTYAPLRRTTSIRRSGFHTSPYSNSNSSQSRNTNASTSAPVSPSTTLLSRLERIPWSSVNRTTTTSTSSPASPGSSARSILRSLSAYADTSATTASTTAERNPASISRYDGPSSPASMTSLSAQRRADSFQNHARLLRQASRLAREAEAEGDSSIDDTRNLNRLSDTAGDSVGNSRSRTSSTRADLSASNDRHAGIRSQMLSPPNDPMLTSTPADAESITEMLGSSSTAAALEGGDIIRGAMSPSVDPSSNAPAANTVSRWRLSPPGAPILSRRSFPLPMNAVPASEPIPPSPPSSSLLSERETFPIPANDEHVNVLPSIVTPQATFPTHATQSLAEPSVGRHGSSPRSPDGTTGR